MRCALTVAIIFSLILFAHGQQPNPSAVASDSPTTSNDSFCDSIGKDIQHPEALTDACRFVLSLRNNLPNVICDQTTSRYVRPSPERFGEKLQDTVTAHVIYEDGRERYSDVRINGVVESKKLSEVEGQYSYGEFGTDLIFAFRAENHPVYRFLRKERFEHHHALVYEAKVSRENNNGWVIQANGHSTYPEFQAELWLDETSHQVLRFDLTPIPESDFPLSHVELLTQYESLALGDGTEFVLPVKSESTSCLWNGSKHRLAFCNYSILVFKDCHKFRAKSRILTDQDPGSQP